MSRHLVPIVLANLSLLPCAIGQGVPVIVETGAPFYIPFNDLTLTQGPRLGGGLGGLTPGTLFPVGSQASIKLEGDVFFDMPYARIDFGDEDPELLGNPPFAVQGLLPEIELGLKGGIALELTAAGSGPFNSHVPLFAVPVAIFYFPAVPTLSGLIYIEGQLAVEGHLEAGMRTSFVGQFELEGLIDFEAGDPVTREPENVAFQFSPPDFSGQNQLDLSVSVEAGVVVEILASGVPFADAFLKVRSGIELEVDPLADPWWDVNYFVEPRAGAGFKLLSPRAVLAPAVAPIDLLDAGGPLGGPAVPARWSRTYDVDDLESVIDATPFEGGFAVVAETAAAGTSGWIAALDAAGSVLWEQRAQSGSQTKIKPKQVRVTGDGGLVVGGTDTGTLGARIDRYTSDGVALWTRGYEYSSGGSLTLNSLVATADGGLAFAGTVLRQPGLAIHPVLVRLDAAGNFLWAVEYDLDEQQEASSGEALRLLETTDGHFILVGSVVYQDVPLPDSSLDNGCALAILIDPDGLLVWAKALGGIGADAALDVAELENGDFVLVGKVSVEDETAWTARIDRAGTLLWSRTLGGDDPNGNDRARSVAATVGGALVAGTSASAGSEDAWLAKIDQDGDVVWFKSYRGLNEDELHGIELIDTGLLAYGRTKSIQPLGIGGGESDMWIVRAPHDGMLHFDPAFGFDAENDLRASSGTDAIVGLDLPGELLAFRVVDQTSNFLLGATLALVTLLTL